MVNNFTKMKTPLNTQTTTISHNSHGEQELQDMGKINIS